MKLNIKHLPVVGTLAVAAMSMGSCTDEIAFGNKFLEKAPGGTVTADTIFHNARYARYYLNQAYTYQYFNLPTRASGNPDYLSFGKGMPDALGDTHQLFYSSASMISNYYGGMLSSTATNVYPYTGMHIWENIRTCNLILERIDEVPDMSQTEKDKIKDEARCLLVNTYFNAFRFYGGLPLVDFTFNGSESNYKGRKSAQDNIDFMLGLLNTVIEGNHLPWAYTGSEAMAEMGHWTIAGAMALKVQILQFAASPLLNSAQPYYQEAGYTMEHPEYVWLGGYDASRWDDYYTACKDFFDTLKAKGHYALTQAEEPTQEGYAYAFRASYILQNSTDIIHTVRVSDNVLDNNCAWFYLGFSDKGAASVVGAGGNERVSYCPTHEYAMMFPWADGTPVDWDKAQADGKLDELFIKGTKVAGQRDLQDVVYTRDPRMYETMAVNGQRAAINWNNGERSGQTYESWIGGTVAGDMPDNQTGVWATGYRNLRYIAGLAYMRQYPQWCQFLLAEMYFNYAEAILQSGKESVANAIKLVDDVRARVGMKGLVECNPDKNLTGDKDALLQEILRERACELSFQMVRYFDLIRYKRADIFSKQLHALHIYRQVNGQDDKKPWFNGQRNDNNMKDTDPNYYEPTNFRYEIVPITNGARVWWTVGFDPKWYFQPFPITEVNKGYGLDQNPGW